MQLVEKIYPSRFLNADDEPNVMGKGEWINLLNLRFASTDEGFAGRLETVPSNAEIVNTYLPATGTNITIGQVSNDADQYIVFLNWNSLGTHGIYLFYKPTSTFYKVLLNAQVSGGLNFNKSNLITAKIVNGMMAWIDTVNQPMKINLAACIKANHGGVSPIASKWQFDFTNPVVSTEFTLIKKPPCTPPGISKMTNGAVASNNIKNESFQFAWYYVYYDGEVSVMSGWSHASFLNKETDTYNFIRVTLPTTDTIPQSVRLVVLVVRTGSTFKSFKLKTWDNFEDTTPINQHNAGNPLTVDFYNTVSGEAIDDAYSVKPFDSVALNAHCIELAHNCYFLGNLTKGYDAPFSTSLNVTGVGNNSSQVIPVTQFQVVAYTSGSVVPPYIITWERTSLILYIPSASTPGWYEITNPNTVIVSGGGAPVYYGPIPSSISFATDLVFLGTDLMAAASVMPPPGRTFLQYSVSPSGSNTTVNSINLGGTQVFKSGASIQLGVVFYDQYLRKCGVVTNDSLKYKLDDRNFNATNMVTSVNWALSNINALSEIPSWAYYYSVVRTDNLKTRSFVQNISNSFFYANKNASTGVWEYTATTFSGSAQAIAIDSTALVQSGLGYVFADGDICNLYYGVNVYQLPVIATDGKWILVKAKDLGPIGGTPTMIYEIYTPYKAPAQEPFYECGSMFAVSNPGTGTRAYNTLNGSISGDVFLVDRNYSSLSYSAEATCPNDKFWKRWDKDDGRINLVTKEGQVIKPTAIQFSNVYVQGTETNGLSTFEALNEEILPVEMGAIQATVLTSKVQKEGTVMLIIGTNQTASVYIGETQVTNQDSTSYFIKSTGVISQVNVLKGDYGTINPESVVLFKGDVRWFDAYSGRFVQYSINGIDDISRGQDNSFKFSRVSQLLAKKFISTSAGTMEGYGSRPFIFGGVDPHHSEVYWTFPKLDTVVPKGQLTDYVGSVPTYMDDADYPYDILDYKAKTFVYKIQDSKWIGAFNWTPEGFITLGSDTHSFKSGKLYKHNQLGSYGTFYGTHYRSKAMLVFNRDNTVKEIGSIGIEGTLPEWVHFRREAPEQSSELVATDFTDREGVKYADVMRDRLTPNAASYAQGQISGDLIKSKAILFLIQFNATSLSFLREVSIGYNNSSGHY